MSMVTRVYGSIVSLGRMTWPIPASTRVPLVSGVECGKGIVTPSR